MFVSMTNLKINLYSSRFVLCTDSRHACCMFLSLWCTVEDLVCERDVQSTSSQSK